MALFDSDKYFSTGEWKVAANYASSHYEKLGFISDDSLSDKQIIEAFHLREDWWTQKDKIARRGQAHPVLKEVGPFIQDAIKNLLEAKSILSDPIRKAQYDKKLKDELVKKAEEELIKFIHFALQGENQISEKEKANLLNMADTLKIGGRGEEIILDEMKKVGATFKLESDSGNKTSSSIPFDILLGQTYYEMLGLSEDADYAQIKEVYEREYKKYNATRDKARAEARWIPISKACECLSDPVKRREYDEPKTPPPTGRPRLVVECKTNYTFSDVRRGTVIHVDKIVIKNPDGGLLQGTIKSDVSWLEPDRNKILEKHEQELYVNILSSKIPVNTYDTKGAVTFDTNGGHPYSIPFRVILEGLEIAADRFRKTYVPLVAACAGFIGSFSGSPFSDFLIDAIIAGVISYSIAKFIVKASLNNGLNIFKFPSILIQGAAAGVIILTIMSHSSDNLVIKQKEKVDIAYRSEKPRVPVILQPEQLQTPSEAESRQVIEPEPEQLQTPSEAENRQVIKPDTNAQNTIPQSPLADVFESRSVDVEPKAASKGVTRIAPTIAKRKEWKPETKSFAPPSRDDL